MTVSAQPKPFEQFRKIPESGSIVRVFYHDDLSNWAWQELRYGKDAITSPPRKNGRCWVVSHWPTGRTVSLDLSRRLKFNEASILAKELDELILEAGQITLSDDGAGPKLVGWNAAIAADIVGVLRDFAGRYDMTFEPGLSSGPSC